MMPNINPRDMAHAMKRMGIKQEEIDAVLVEIKTQGGKKIVVRNPSVVKLNMMGQESFQVSGTISEEDAAGEIKEEDVLMVAGQAGTDNESARRALIDSNGDIAGAILKLANK